MANSFHFFEQYEGREGFEEHTQTPHFAAWEKFVETDPFTEPPVVTFYTQRGAGAARAGSAALLSKARAGAAGDRILGNFFRCSLLH